MAKRTGRKRRHIRLPLAKVITTVIDEQVGDDGVLDYDKAVKRGYLLLMESERRGLVEQGLWQRLKQAMARGRASASGSKTRDFGDVFPGLYRAYTLDLNGEHTTKQTDMLTELEFKRAIAIREAQVIADTEALEVLRRAYASVKPIWESHPDLTFGEVCEIYRRDRAASAA